MILSGLAVQTTGLGLSLVSARKRLMAAWRPTIERKTPRLVQRKPHHAPGGRVNPVDTAGLERRLPVQNNILPGPPADGTHPARLRDGPVGLLGMRG